MDEPSTSLSLEQVRHIAKLARLRLSDAELQRYQGQLSAVLTHIAKLNELKLEGVEPMAHPMEMTNRLDEDSCSRAMPLEHLVANAPAIEDRYLAVPKVLAEEGP